MTTPNLSAARQAARSLVSTFAITAPERVLLEDIAMSRGVLVQDGPLDGAEARLVRGAGNGIIRVRAGLPEQGRRRFAIAHELGHWELHRGHSQMRFCENNDVHGYRTDPAELEANAFAGELLMPRRVFRDLLGMAPPSIALVGSLSEAFQTTLTATAVRFVEEYRGACLAVFSESGRVRWVRKRDGVSTPWIEPDQELHPESLAWEISIGRTPTGSGMRLVPEEAWFQNLRRGLRVEVREDSAQLGRYPTILSLLDIVEYDAGYSQEDED